MFNFKNTISVPLYKAVKLKDYLEKQWFVDQNKLIQDNNILHKSVKCPIELAKIEAYKDRYSAFLCDLHALISEANMKKLKGEEFCNNYNVKLRSELNKERLLLQKLDTTPKKDSVILLSVTEVNKRLKDIHDKMAVLDEKLSKFNQTTHIELPKNPKLYELYKVIDVKI